MRRRESLIVRIFTIAALILGMAMGAWGAGIRIVPSSARVTPGEEFFFDVVAEWIPAEGLGGVQFRLSLAPSSGTVAGVPDLNQAGANDIAVVAPLLVSPAVAGRSGMGEFFWGGKGPNGILVMDNEPLANGSGLYTFAHTSAAAPSSGSGTVARFAARIGSGVKAERLDISLSDVMLLDNGLAYSLDYVNNASLQLRCIARVPSLLGLDRVAAQAALTVANLTLGSVYEVDNQAGALPLGVVLEQSSPPGGELDCLTPLNLAINTPPADPGAAASGDKLSDDSGTVVLSWTPSTSTDTAGYRVYSGTGLLKQIAAAVAGGAEVGGLANGVATRLRVTAYDTLGNESAGAFVDALPIDDVPPVIAINGITDGGFHRMDVTPQVTISDAGPVAMSATLNGAPFTIAAIAAEGAHTLTVSAIDQAGNSSARTVSFTLDKSAPAISVVNVSDNAFYNTAVTPLFTISDTYLLSSSTTLDGQPCLSGTKISEPGSHILLVSAEDSAGNSATQTIRFTIDTTVPALAVSTLSDGSYTNNEVLNIAGTVGDDTGVKELTINGVTVPLNADGGYSHALLLATGGNRIEVVATDLAGNRTSEIRTVNLDQAAPLLVVSLPADNSKTATALMDVTGSVDETSTVTVKLGESVQTAAMTGSAFIAPLALIPGYNTIEVTATDLAGNRSSQKRTVVYDDQSPSLAVTIPAQDIRTNLGGLTIRGAVSDLYTAVSVSIGMDGLTFTPPVENGQFEQAVAFTTEKSYAIAVTAVDEVGRSTSVQRNVIYDITPPTLAIDTAITPTVLPSQVIGGTREAGLDVTVTCPTATVGAVEYPTDTTWRVALAGMGVGDNVVTAQSSDAAGNQATVYSHVKVVTVDSDVAFTVTPNIIWPPNHKMVPVTIGGKLNIPVADAQSVDISLADEYGLYSYENLKFGATVLLEAWRDAADKDGRRYTITAVVTRRDGSKTTTATNVLVPHDAVK